ncbi:MAG: thioredoxin family protein [Bacteroidota bacterium]
MGKSFKFVLIMVVMAITLHSARAQERRTSVTRISGSVANIGLPNIKAIHIQFYENWFYSGHIAREISVNKNGEFSFDLPNYNQPFHLHLVILSDLDQSPYFSTKVFVEPGDNIQVKFIKNGSTDSAIFSGKRSEKYNLIQTLEYYMTEYTEKERFFPIATEIDSAKLDRALINYTEFVNFYQKKINNIINSAPNISSKIKDVIVHKYAIFDQWAFRLSTGFKNNRGNSRLQKVILDSFRKNENNFYVKPNAFSHLGPTYISSLKIWEQSKLEISGSKPNLRSVYDSLKKKYTGLLQEKVLASLLIKPYDLLDSKVVFDSLVLAIQPLAVTPYIKNALATLIKLRKGADVLNASFIDRQGNLFNLGSLKGKALLIDIWFLGCGGCAQFHEKFHKSIYPLLKDNKKFKYVSINIDKEKDKWIKGIESGLYTSDDYMNLNTQGEGLEHDFTRFYDIKGGPYLLLVDANGKIYGQPVASASSELLLSWINEAGNAK